MIKILIADDQELIRQSLLIILDNIPDFHVTDTAADGQEVIRCVKRERPDVILMDIRMPKMDGVICTQILKEQYPDVKIIILTTFDDDKYVFDALKYGASGYLLKGISMKELSDAIRKVYQGTAMIHRIQGRQTFLENGKEQPDDPGGRAAVGQPQEQRVADHRTGRQGTLQQGDRRQAQFVRGNGEKQPEQHSEQTRTQGQDAACDLGGAVRCDHARIRRRRAVRDKSAL